MLSLKRALEISTGVLSELQARGFEPLGVAVLDAGANVLAVLRDERASFGPIGRNARDLDLFVRLFDFSPIDASLQRRVRVVS